MDSLSIHTRNGNTFKEVIKIPRYYSIIERANILGFGILVVGLLILLTYRWESHQRRPIIPNDDLHRVQFDMFTDLLAKSITGFNLRTPGYKPGEGSTADLRVTPFDASKRLDGRDWPQFGVSMAGVKNLLTVRDLIVNIEENNIAGDFVEAGVWRGGTSIMARLTLNYIGANNARDTWLFDSFAGLPKSTTNHDSDAWSRMGYVAVSLEEVQQNFDSFGASFGAENGVHFVKGFHCDTFPGLKDGRIPLKQIAILLWIFYITLGI